MTIAQKPSPFALPRMLPELKICVRHRDLCEASPSQGVQRSYVKIVHGEGEPGNEAMHTLCFRSSVYPNATIFGRGMHLTYLHVVS